jgi:hypothetical protein
MTAKFTVGDHLFWNSEAGHVSGKIIKVHTKDVDYKGWFFAPVRERQISGTYLYLSSDSNERVPFRACYCIEGDEQSFSLNVVPGGCCRAVLNYSGIVLS